MVRLSGPAALKIARVLFVPAKRRAPQESWPSHRALFGSLHDPQHQTELDQCLLLYMQAPHSYTGEDLIELHCHGGAFLLRTVLQVCLEQGARLAEAGEFTQRAFLNGKLDLVQAEAVADLIHGHSRRGLHQAAHQLEGFLSRPLRQVRRDLLHLLASIEANIDFPDEVDPVAAERIDQTLQQARTEIDRLLATSESGRIWKQGLRLAIVGAPNVGKSTLLNALLRYDRAIVSELPGTTRDTIEDDYNLKGIPIRIVDTAGLRETEDRIEAIGIERSHRALNDADLVLVLADAREALSPEMQDLLRKESHRDLVLIYNKIDLASEPPEVGAFEAEFPVYTISALENTGLETLEEGLYTHILKRLPAEQEISINERHRLCLLRAKEALQSLDSTLQADLPTDFLAIDLKESIQAFGEILGESISEEVIHEIFHQFCVGK